MSIESVMPSNHLILCCPLLLPFLGKKKSNYNQTSLYQRSPSVLLLTVTQWRHLSPAASMHPVATQLEWSSLCRETSLSPYLTCLVKTSHFNGQEHHESPLTEEGTGYLRVGGRRGMRTQICGHLSCGNECSQLAVSSQTRRKTKHNPETHG